MGTFDVSERAPIRTKQSDSKVTSCKTMTFVKEMAMSIALASASRGTSGNGSCMLKAASTSPMWSRTMTLMLMYIMLWALGPLGPITLLVQHTYTCTALYLYRTLMPPI